MVGGNVYEVVSLEREPDLKLDGLSLWALAREFPDSDDYWDGNWLHIHAVVEAPGARVEITGPWLRTADIARFASQLLTLDEELSGNAQLQCIEPMLQVELACKALGRIAVEISITPDHMTQSHRFSFFIDQTYLNPLRRACARMLDRFPIKGTPS